MQDDSSQDQAKGGRNALRDQPQKRIARAKKAGKSTLAKYGRAYYQELQKRSVESRKRKRDQAEADARDS